MVDNSPVNPYAVGSPDWNQWNANYNARLSANADVGAREEKREPLILKPFHRYAIRVDFGAPIADDHAIRIAQAHGFASLEFHHDLLTGVWLGADRAADTFDKAIEFSE